MGKADFQSPVIDSVRRVNSEIAVGEDLEFQRKWWTFERLVWIFVAAVLLLTLLGAFGRGWLAKKQSRSSDGNLTLKYDRIQRTGTPSDMTVMLGSGAIRNGQIRLFVSQSVMAQLGSLRISPQPEHSLVGNGGVTYIFPANGSPATVVFSLEPSGPSRFGFRVVLPDIGSEVDSKVVVMP